MKQVSRVTLISPDKSTEHVVQDGKAHHVRTGHVVKIPTSECPGWVTPGCDVVAANDDGSVFCSYTVRRVLTIDTSDSAHHGAEQPLTILRSDDPHS